MPGGGRRLEENSEIGEGIREAENIMEDDLQGMPYLKAVIMESLRRHPPAYFALPHSVTEDVTIEKFLLPKGAKVRFSVADVNWDKKNWEESMLFRPERFMVGTDRNDEVDLTGSKEIKMLTFGAGRRMCPGYVLAILHLELFVANLVEFLWKPERGEEVDLSEKLELTTIMKNPLRAQIIPRRKK
ncbi:Cytochrome P450 89A2 [Platanthera guangdongensis]|uniref:Cytochrome P450 89A2 n=1 Tax=Platanthera guangdongensis TaxID=2320717 RepID=A0ABR2LID4_9ASPA